ncbi:hypothetical protein HNR62_001963 [Oceanisphaera litoralis]|uniref:hypothetical protein n=1 Tax=Oceanisphaera litoralis TaxID=225144 RepID=UPI0019574384|nr:hypothetical protein [Oceanisphaera litoralis]MBM7456082.1 hypothetical protein [Oceanisphaera litoralis]
MSETEFAEQIRQRCRQAALTAGEEGGLCRQGRFELAIAQEQGISLPPLLAEFK